MRRIILMVGLAMLMATFAVVSALPAFAATDSIDVECIAPNGDSIFFVGTGERPRTDLGAYRQECKDLGGRLTLTALPEPGPSSDKPPCCVPVGARP